MTFLLKACPKCGGDIYPERTMNGDISLVCLQCGYELRGVEREKALALVREARPVARTRRQAPELAGSRRGA